MLQPKMTNIKTQKGINPSGEQSSKAANNVSGGKEQKNASMFKQLLQATSNNKKNGQSKNLKGEETKGNDANLFEKISDQLLNPQKNKNSNIAIKNKANQRDITGKQGKNLEQIIGKNTANSNEAKSDAFKINHKLPQVFGQKIPQTQDSQSKQIVKDILPKQQTSKNNLVKQLIHNETPVNNSQLKNINKAKDLNSAKSPSLKLYQGQAKSTNSNIIRRPAAIDNLNISNVQARELINQTNGKSIKAKTAKDELKVNNKNISNNKMNNAAFMVTSINNAGNNNSNIANAQNVLQMDNMTPVANQEQLIEQISNYIIQSSTAKQDNVSLSFQHGQLGKIDLNIMQVKDQEGLHININTNAVEGAEFFSKNQNGLLQALQQAGIKVTEFKLDQGMMNNESRQNFDQTMNQNSQQQQFYNNHRQQQQDSDRRRNLWEQMYHKDVA